MHREALTEAGFKLLPSLAAFDDFYLAGGTALALQIGHRVSVDFDFFGDGPIDQMLLPKVKRVFPGISVEPAINNPEELTVFLGTVKLTLLSYPFPIVEPLVSWEGLRMLSVKEIGATKAYTTTLTCTSSSRSITPRWKTSSPWRSKSSVASLTRGSSPSNCFSWMTFGTTTSIS
jgi:hypothetical protein